MLEIMGTMEATVLGKCVPGFLNPSYLICCHYPAENSKELKIKKQTLESQKPVLKDSVPLEKGMMTTVSSSCVGVESVAKTTLNDL